VMISTGAKRRGGRLSRRRLPWRQRQLRGHLPVLVRVEAGVPAPAAPMCASRAWTPNQVGDIFENLFGGRGGASSGGFQLRWRATASWPATGQRCRAANRDFSGRVGTWCTAQFATYYSRYRNRA
jgi:hypothetical protein